jgi:hypothetical protein
MTADDLIRAWCQAYEEDERAVNKLLTMWEIYLYSVMYLRGTEVTREEKRSLRGGE